MTDEEGCLLKVLLNFIEARRSLDPPVLVHKSLEYIFLHIDVGNKCYLSLLDLEFLHVESNCALNWTPCSVSSLLSVAHNLINRKISTEPSRTAPSRRLPRYLRSAVCPNHALKDDPRRGEEGSALFVSEILCVRLGHQYERNDSCL